MMSSTCVCTASCNNDVLDGGPPQANPASCIASFLTTDNIPVHINVHETQLEKAEKVSI